MWIIYALLSALFASLTAIFVKLGVQHIHSDLATAIRTIIVLIMTWTIVLFRGELKSFHGINRTSLTFLIVSGIATGLSWIFYFKAIQIGKVSQVAMIDKLSVVLTLFLAAIFIGEPLTPKVLIAMGLIISGVLVLIY